MNYRLNQTEGANQLDQADERELQKSLSSKTKEHQKMHREFRKEQAKRAVAWKESPRNKSAVKTYQKSGAGTLIGVVIIIMFIIGGIMTVIRTSENNGGITTYEFSDSEAVESSETGAEP